MAAKDKNGPGNNKAYMPVPKGYKGNWNTPKGTPWKKDSPYNPANKNKGPTSRGVSPESLDSAKKKAAASSSSRVVSRTSGPKAIASAKAKESSRVSASIKSSDNKMMTMAKQGNATAAASKKRMASPSSNVTKKPAGYKPAVAPKGITPSDRRGSMDNIKRAAQTNRANQASAAASSAASTKKSVVTGAANKMRRFA
jgi:hypothetical protein